MSFWDASFLWLEPMIASLIGAGLLGYLGFFVVLRRIAFMSAALSQVSGLGVATAFWVGSFFGISPHDDVAFWFSPVTFALGFALCLPTAFLLVYNGASFGAFVALFVGHQLGFEVSGWLIIHGVTEIFACILSGAAGFRIGWSVIFPGDRARLEAAAESGRLAATAMVGVVIMLMLAGLLEGFGRQLITIDAARYAVGLATGVVWLLYFYLPRGVRRERR